MALFLRAAFFLRARLAMAPPSSNRIQSRPVCHVADLVFGGGPMHGFLVRGRACSAGAEEGTQLMSAEIRAEMVANVMTVVVHDGDPVRDGDSLVVLESMKMEIPVLTEVDGRVGRIAVSEGDVVQEGDLLAVVE